MAGEPTAAQGRPLGSSASSDFVIRHCRSSTPSTRNPSIRPFLPSSRPAALDVGRAASSSSGGDRLAHRPRAERDAGAPGGYTSLRELIDSPRSPDTPRGAAGGWEIRIKNHLVKQAAYAYLQPTPSASESDHRRSTLRRALSLLTCGLAVDPLDLCIAFLRRLFRRPR